MLPCSSVLLLLVCPDLDVPKVKSNIKALCLLLIFIAAIQMKHQDHCSLHDVGGFCDNLCSSNNKKQAIRNCATQVYPLA